MSVKIGGELRDPFETVIEFLQGCVLLPLLFNILLELIKATVLDDKETGMQIGGERINNVSFANNTALLIESLNEE